MLRAWIRRSHRASSCLGATGNLAGLSGILFLDGACTTLDGGQLRSGAGGLVAPAIRSCSTLLSAQQQINGSQQPSPTSRMSSIMRTASFQVAVSPLQSSVSASSSSSAAVLLPRLDDTWLPGVIKSSLRHGSTCTAFSISHPKHLAANQQQQQQQQPCKESAATPLQQQLAQAGVRDWEEYCQEHHDRLSVTVIEYVAKVVELNKEGPGVQDVDRLFCTPSNSIRRCSFEGVFLPNLTMLRGLTAGQQFERRPSDPEGLTLLGRMLRNQPFDMRNVLSRDPALIAQLSSWVTEELKVSQQQFAKCVCKYPQLLRLSLAQARAVMSMFSQLGLSQDECTRMLLRRPLNFGSRPATLMAKMERLRQVLQLGDHREVVQLVLKMPQLLSRGLQHLDQVVSELDELLGRQGAGADLIMRNPVLAGLQSIQKPLATLRDLGYSGEELADLVTKYPMLLTLNLNGPVMRQKVEWAAEELGLPLQKLLSSDFFSRNLCRMASHLAFMRYLGLPRPAGYRTLSQEHSTFFKAVSRRVGREVCKAEFDAFVGQWLQTEEGVRWGFKPDKVQGLS